MVRIGNKEMPKNKNIQAALSYIYGFGKKFGPKSPSRQILEELEWDRLLVSSAQQLLNDYRQRIIICQCLGSEKVRVKYLNSDGSGWTECERCERLIDSAGHHRIVRNRNDPRFWGIESEWKALCLECLGKFREEMPTGKRYTLNKYLKRGYI